MNMMRATQFQAALERANRLASEWYVTEDFREHGGTGDCYLRSKTWDRAAGRAVKAGPYTRDEARAMRGMVEAAERAGRS